MQKGIPPKRQRRDGHGRVVEIILKVKSRARASDSVDEAQSDSLDRSRRCLLRIDPPKAESLRLKCVPAGIGRKSAENEAVALKLDHLRTVGGAEQKAGPIEVRHLLLRPLPGFPSPMGRKGALRLNARIVRELGLPIRLEPFLMPFDTDAATQVENRLRDRGLEQPRKAFRKVDLHRERP